MALTKDEQLHRRVVLSEEQAPRLVPPRLLFEDRLPINLHQDVPSAEAANFRSTITRRVLNDGRHSEAAGEWRVCSNFHAVELLEHDARFPILAAFGITHQSDCVELAAAQVRDKRS